MVAMLMFGMIIGFPREHGFKPFTPDLLGFGSFHVSNLINHATGHWDVNMVMEIFWSDDVESILSIPLTTVHTRDVRIWHFTKHGHFSVRSAYYLARKMKTTTATNTGGQSSSLVSENWEWIWKLNIPNKIKIFFWRALKNSLPVCTLLQRRGVDIINVCPVCDGSRKL